MGQDLELKVGYLLEEVRFRVGGTCFLAGGRHAFFPLHEGTTKSTGGRSCHTHSAPAP